LLKFRLVVVSARRPPVNSWSARHVSTLWNSLPDNITAASSLADFRRKLKTHLLRQSYPDTVWYSFSRQGGP